VFRRHDDQHPTTGPKGRRSSRRQRARAAEARGPESGGRLPSGGDAQELFIVEALHDLRDTDVREVMTPRVDVVALSIPVTADDVTRVVRESGHRCFPVYDDNLDDLIGVLFVNDLFRSGWRIQSGRFERRPPGGPGPTVLPADGLDEPEAGEAEVGIATPDPLDISRRLRQPFLVPESRLVLDVLAEMRRQRRAFAVVVDEHGGVEGVLTVKDLLGALVGDLPDEFDPEDEPDMVRVDGSRWLVDGRTSVDDVRERLGINVAEGEYVTLGGYLFDAFGHIPSEGESIEVGGWQLRVAEMDKRRVAKVVAKRLIPATPGIDGRGAGGDPGTGRTTVG
jgi:CBS domain containing-hemolysin-like protein